MWKVLREREKGTSEEVNDREREREGEKGRGRQK